MALMKVGIADGLGEILKTLDVVNRAFAVIEPNGTTSGGMTTEQITV